MTENGSAHLNDEWLSSYLDGEQLPPSPAPRHQATGGEEEPRTLHLDSCETCTNRLEALRAAKLLLATPVDSPSVALRTRAIASAMTAFDDGPARTGPWYRSRRMFIVAAAAAVVALAVSLPLTLTGKSTSSTSAARSAHASASGGRAGAAGNATEGAASSGSAAAGGASAGAAALPGSSGSLELPDLGSVNSKKELVARVRTLGGPTGTPSSASSQGLGPFTNSPSQQFSISSGSVANCVTATQNAIGAHFGPGLVAAVTYDGQRSIVMELWKSDSQPPAGQDHVAVATENGCKLLLTTTF